MDKSLRKKIVKAVVRLDAGRKGVRVSLQYQPRLETGSRSERRERLLERFSQIAQAIAADSAEVDLSSVSVSGQTVEATLPLDRYENLVENLAQQRIRVDPLVDEQIVPE